MKWDSKIKKKVDDAMLKKAIGYNFKEKVEELVLNDDGKLEVSKRKVTNKHVPPDISAVRLLLEMNDKIDELGSLTDAELEEERKKLLKILKEKDLGSGDMSD